MEDTTSDLVRGVTLLKTNFVTTHPLKHDNTSLQTSLLLPPFLNISKKSFFRFIHLMIYVVY